MKGKNRIIITGIDKDGNKINVNKDLDFTKSKGNISHVTFKPVKTAIVGKISEDITDMSVINGKVKEPVVHLYESKPTRFARSIDALLKVVEN